MWHLLNPTTVATPAFIVLVIAEMIFVRFTGRGRYETRDTATSLLMGFGSVIFGTLAGITFLAFFAVVRPFRFADIAWSWPAVGLCFVLDDITYYAWHRAAHRVRWFWAEHVSHHSSQHFNLSTALRQPWGGFLTPSFVFKAPLILMGFPLAMMAFVGGVNLVYQFWVHTESIGRLPRWVEAVFNTPSHHRVHHATNAGYLDSNYAGAFILWDRLFGTFAEERAEDPPHYGIVRNLATFNPLKVAVHEFIGLGQDIATARSAREIAHFVLAPPGWSPDGSRETSDSIKARWRAYRAGRKTETPGDLIAAPQAAE